jgi:chromosome segregation ATPase
METKFLSKESEISSLKRQLENNETEKRRYLNQLQQIKNENAALNEELNRQNSKNQELSSNLHRLEERLSDSKHEESSLPYVKEKFLKERENLEKQNKWLEEHLNQKSKELLQIRNELVRKSWF